MKQKRMILDIGGEKVRIKMLDHQTPEDRDWLGGAF